MHEAPEPDLRARPEDAPATPGDRGVSILVAIAAVVVAGVVGAWLWSTRQEPPGPPVPSPPVSEVPLQQAPPAPAAAASASAAASAVQHPVPADDRPLAASDIPEALTGVLGGKAAATFLQTDNFPRRFAATVDSLGREHSPSAMWPVLPTPGRFLVEERPEGPVIAPENASRYTPFVLLAGTVDVRAAVRLYRRMYPLLQQAYSDLGFGERYLNDRVVEVIDLLLATPDAPASPRLELLEVKGSVPSLRPWVRYHYADPALEGLSAGQKILVRVGPVNQQRLKSKLAELRKELTGPALPAAAASAPEVAAEPASATAAPR